MTALLQGAVSLRTAMGFTAEEAIRALYPLAKITLENAERMDTVGSVTGPVVRGDTGTVEAHLKALARQAPEVAPLYQALALASLPLAQERGVAPSRLQAMRELMDT